MEETSTRLYDLGRQDLESRFDPSVTLVRNRFLPDRHLPHDSLWYAHCLLEDGRIEEAEAIVEAVLGLQELRPNDPHHGNFWWHLEDGAVIDLNACQFVLESLIAFPVSALSGPMQERVEATMRLAFEEATRLNVHWTYTNIYLLDVHNRILGGELLGDANIQKTGAARLEVWAAKTRQVGAPHEFNSPTYTAVQLNCLAGIAQHTSDPGVRDIALEMEELVWRHVARYWHSPTMQLGGPHSRAYRRDVVGASGFLKVVLYKLLGDERLLAKSPYYEGHDAEGHLIVARTDYHCPPDAEKMLRASPDRTFRETVCIAPPVEAVATLAPTYSLGSMSRPYGVGEPPEPWPQNNSCIAYWRRDETPGYGGLYCRFRINSGHPGDPSPQASPLWLDVWEDGVFWTAQNRASAIVAYGLPPRGPRPLTDMRLDIRLLGPHFANVVLPDGTLWNGESSPVPPGPIVVADGSAYIGLIPLEATDLGRNAWTILWRDGLETVVSVVNYTGPPKMFWEYRSLSGPFWKGNIRNGFALRIVDREEFPSAASFADALARAPLADEVTGSIRRISLGTGDDVVRLEYDLLEIWP